MEKSLWGKKGILAVLRREKILKHREENPWGLWVGESARREWGMLTYLNQKTDEKKKKIVPSSGEEKSRAVHTWRGSRQDGKSS